MLNKIEHLLPLLKKRIKSWHIYYLRKNKYDTVDKVEESRTTSVSNRPNEITILEKIPKPSEVIIPKANFYVSILTRFA